MECLTSSITYLPPHILIMSHRPLSPPPPREIFCIDSCKALSKSKNMLVEGEWCLIVSNSLIKFKFLCLEHFGFQKIRYIRILTYKRFFGGEATKIGFLNTSTGKTLLRTHVLITNLKYIRARDVHSLNFCRSFDLYIGLMINSFS